MIGSSEEEDEGNDPVKQIEEWKKEGIWRGIELSCSEP